MSIFGPFAQHSAQIRTTADSLLPYPVCLQTLAEFPSRGVMTFPIIIPLDNPMSPSHSSWPQPSVHFFLYLTSTPTSAHDRVDSTPTPPFPAPPPVNAPASLWSHCRRWAYRNSTDSETVWILAPTLTGYECTGKWLAFLDLSFLIWKTDHDGIRDHHFWEN